ncbi:MAG TPA: SRPBCC family protein [Jatrophihabitans sp.]|jgi:carbon monoxide dehydrogenase subunit G|nr:SRPBCC family protein [Jatrophihabitans sp.]
MRLENEFTVPVAPDEAWAVLLDVQQLAPCMPGATVDSVDGDIVTGRVKVKIGPMAMTYHGTLKFQERNEREHRVVLDAAANEVRGSGTARATVAAALTDTGGHTRIAVTTDLQITGRAAQFGQSVLAEISGRIIAQFADNLATELRSRTTPTIAAADTPDVRGEADVSAARPRAVAPSAPGAARSDSINLISAVGAPILKRLLPVVAAALLLLLMQRRKKSGRACR